MKAFISLLVGLLLVGCSRIRERYEATFVAIIEDSDLGEVTWYSEAPQWGLSVNIAVKIMESRQFWEQCVKPRLPPSLVGDDRVREEVKISASEYRIVGKRLLAELRIEIGAGGEVVFDAILAGFEQIMKERAMNRYAERGQNLATLLRDAKTAGDVAQQNVVTARLSRWSTEKSDPKLIHNGRFVLEVRKP